MPDNAAADKAKEVYLNRYAALKQQLVGKPLAWLTMEHDVGYVLEQLPNRV